MSRQTRWYYAAALLILVVGVLDFAYFLSPAQSGPDSLTFALTGLAVYGVVSAAIAGVGYLKGRKQQRLPFTTQTTAMPAENRVLNTADGVRGNVCCNWSTGMNLKVPAVLLVSLGLAFWVVYSSIPHKVLEPAGEFTMVLVQAGEFMMGSTPEEVTSAVEECAKDTAIDGDPCNRRFKRETPRHRVALDAFYLDRYEVTNQLFEQFVRATGYQTTAEREGNAWVFVEGKDWQKVSGANWRQPETGALMFDSNRATHPVVSVSWKDANTFCRSYGKRLPTEAEFEYALRAGTQTKYWWGDGSPGSRRVANIADETNKREFPGRPWPIMEGYTDGYARTAPVGSFEANAFGLYDMTGNAAEWTADWYGEKYYNVSPVRNPKGPSSGQYRVFRGGSWNDRPLKQRSANRHGDTPSYRVDNLGFRCAQDNPR